MLKALEPFLKMITRVPILVLNGWLYLLYAFLDHAWLWVVMAAGVLILCVFDMASVQLVRSAPSRIGGRPAPPATSGWGVRVYTGLVLALSFVGGLIYAEPIPFILAIMWLMAAVALWLLPAEREPLLWRVKGTLLLYALALIGFKLYLMQAQAAAPEDWAALIGSVGSARDALTHTRDLFTTVGLWAIWFIVPIGHVAYLIQRLLIHPASLFHARQSAEEIIAALRRRA